MKHPFDHALLKVWFRGAHTSRNFSAVVEAERRGGVLVIRNSAGASYVLNWNNINLIEEVNP